MPPTFFSPFLSLCTFYSTLITTQSEQTSEQAKSSDVKVELERKKVKPKRENWIKLLSHFSTLASLSFGEKLVAFVAIELAKRRKRKKLGAKSGR